MLKVYVYMLGLQNVLYKLDFLEKLHDGYRPKSLACFSQEWEKGAGKKYRYFTTKHVYWYGSY